jgi:putative hydrolase of the HAD superfamily
MMPLSYQASRGKERMQHIRAIGFDLFDTLITVQGLAHQEALSRLLGGLQAHGLAVEGDTFLPVYRDVARAFVSAARQDGRETHNRFWISTALHRLGHAIAPDDGSIAAALAGYFSAFLEYATPLPGTHDMLAALKSRYRLGVLSNFTHAPAVQEILSRLGLLPYFDVVLVSGALGYRKPHAQVFAALWQQFDVPKAQIAFVGDDLEADIQGAQTAGMQPIWTTYASTQRATPTTLAAGPAPTNEAAPAVPMVASWHDLLRLLAV